MALCQAYLCCQPMTGGDIAPPRVHRHYSQRDPGVLQQPDAQLGKSLGDVRARRRACVAMHLLPCCRESLDKLSLPTCARSLRLGVPNMRQSLRGVLIGVQCQQKTGRHHACSALTHPARRMRLSPLHAAHANSIARNLLERAQNNAGTPCDHNALTACPSARASMQQSCGKQSATLCQSPARSVICADFSWRRAKCDL